MRPVPIIDAAVRRLVSTAAVVAFAEVAAGAFGAHGLRDRISPEALGVWETGARYGLVHAVGAILAAALAPSLGVGATRAGWCLLAGSIVFSGSLFALALGAPRGVGMTTPIGGVLFLSGWALLARAAMRS